MTHLFGKGTTEQQQNVWKIKTAPDLNKEREYRVKVLV